MKLVTTTFVSLDGVYQGPGSPDEDRSDGFSRGGWFVPYLEPGFLAQAKTWLEQADGLLLGRRTYESFSRDWPEMNKPDDAIGLLMNRLPKYVASATLAKAEWGPVTVLRGDALQEIEALKARAGRELQVHGSGSLARSLLAAGLVDELRLVVAPVIVGTGHRLFADSGVATAMRALRNDTTPGGLNIQVFERVGAPYYQVFQRP
ncbi:MAG TPA: dihydrofolate reductase family protein [Devosia sp.]|jgi:dihydrofolate reductase|uniref:dihydrofolate reductase family protein n=1 Tax=Devosia sp. TaxID=1871048 RepID=UPI002DDC9291|nr:dihydrofolate reductase family protein [Devosia sp.]HEV2514587.1 dihydrofolate reductase family protein [Devosia sp.]